MRSHRLTIIAVVAFLYCVLAGVVPVVSQSNDGLERLLLAEVARMPARVGVYVKSLNTGEEVSIRSDEIFSSQSTRKIPIMILAFQSAVGQARVGAASPSGEVTGFE